MRDPLSADLFDGPLGAVIGFVDVEKDVVDELESVVHHEFFHGFVIVAAPILAGEEGPADFDRIGGFADRVKSCAADRFAGFFVDHNKCAFGFHGLLEKEFEAGFCGTLLGGMLFPDKGVRGRFEEVVKVFCL